MQAILNVSLFVTNDTTDVEQDDSIMYTINNGIVSAEARRIVYTFNVPLYLITAVVGGVTNMINIIVFYRQGILCDSCTPSLTAMAFTDLCVGSTIILTMSIGAPVNLGIISYYTNMPLYYNLTSLAWLLGNPIRMFMEMSSGTMAFLSIERMVSVAFPFSVRNIFTPKRSLIIIACIWVYSFAIYLHSFLFNKFKWVTSENGTVNYIRVVPTGMVTAETWELMSLIKDCPIRFIRITAVVICNAIIITKVRKSKQFKADKANQNVALSKPSNQLENEKNKDSNSTSNQNARQHQHREIKLMRMIVVLSSMYVICYFPVLVKETLFYIDYKLVEFGYWYDPYWIMDQITDYFEFINISINIIIYCVMSSRYREELKKLFSCLNR